MRNFLWLFLLVFFSCNPTGDEQNFTTMSFVPIYAPVQTSKVISSGPARTIKHAGKIYAYGNYLFQVE
jgi:hypothetical protein